MRILCTGLSHKTADVALRERFALDAVALRRALTDLSSRWSEAEFTVLSTCNRMEIYVARQLHGHPREEEVREWLASLGGVTGADLAGNLYTLADREACRHLFAVASGLDSLVPGEVQIVSQVKDAYTAATECGTAGRFTNALFQAALHVAKHIRTETPISEGKVSVASVAVDHVIQESGDVSEKRILCVGAGKVGELMLQRLGALQPAEILVCNRTAGRSESLAQRCGGHVVPFADLARHLARVDVVLASTSSETPIITRSMVSSAQSRRGRRPLLIVDLAVPRDVEAGVGGVEGVTLLNIDDLESVVRRNLHLRREQQSLADKYIDSHLTELMGTLSIREVAPTIRELHAVLKRIAEEELDAASRRLPESADRGREEEALRRALRRTVRRILHDPTQRLRRAAGTSAARPYVKALRDLFGLDHADPDS
jgi:glutamyl-tRNA reductase